MITFLEITREGFFSLSKILFANILVIFGMEETKSRINEDRTTQHGMDLDGDGICLSTWEPRCFIRSDATNLCMALRNYFWVPIWIWMSV